MSFSKKILRSAFESEAGETTATRELTDVSGHAKVFGLEDLVSRRVGEDSLGVDAGLVGEAEGTKESAAAAM